MDLEPSPVYPSDDVSSSPNEVGNFFTSFSFQSKNLDKELVSISLHIEVPTLKSHCGAYGEIGGLLQNPLNFIVLYPMHSELFVHQQEHNGKRFDGNTALV